MNSLDLLVSPRRPLSISYIHSLGMLNRVSSTGKDVTEKYLHMFLLTLSVSG